MSTDDIALNPQIEANERALLPALLQSLDHGILMSDLKRQATSRTTGWGSSSA